MCSLRSPRRRDLRDWRSLPPHRRRCFLSERCYLASAHTSKRHTNAHSVDIQPPCHLHADRYSAKHAHLSQARVPGRAGDGHIQAGLLQRYTRAVEWLRVPLEHAAARGNLDVFNKLLGAGANGSAGWRGCRDRTLLDAAAVGGNADVVSGLLQAGAQPDVKVVSCFSKRLALCTATILGNEDAARKLVLVGADENFQDPVRRSTVLHEAVRGGHGQLVKDLLLAGASIDVRDECGSTPLHIAATKGLDGIISDLLLKGADKDARDNRGNSPLILAARHGHVSAAKTLLTSGAKFNFRCTGHPGRSALGWAAKKGHVRVLQAILDHGANVNSRDRGGNTALHLAAFSDQAGVVHALIEAGADIEDEGSFGLTPFYTAGFFTSRRAMLALLQRGADVNRRANDGLPPLHLACLNRAPGVQAAVDLLLRWGADETAVDTDGGTASELLDVSSGPKALQGEIENTRLLLARAPADRAWRRRGWLVMLRSRTSKARTVGHAVGGNSSDSESGGGSNGTSDREGEGCKAARKENGRVVSHTASEQARSGGGGAEEGVLGLSDVVALLFGLETEGVFRTVVGYL